MTKTYTISLWIEEPLYKCTNLIVEVEAETELDALAIFKQHLLDIGLSPQEVTELTYNSYIISENYNDCNGGKYSWLN